MTPAAPPGTAGCRPHPCRPPRVPRHRHRRPGASTPGPARHPCVWGKLQHLKGPGRVGGQLGLQLADPGSGSGRRVASTRNGPEEASVASSPVSRSEVGSDQCRSSRASTVGPMLDQASQQRPHSRNVMCWSSAGLICARCAPPAPGGKPIMCASTGRSLCPSRGRPARPPRARGAGPPRRPPAVRR